MLRRVLDKMKKFISLLLLSSLLGGCTSVDSRQSSEKTNTAAKSKTGEKSVKADAKAGKASGTVKTVISEAEMMYVKALREPNKIKRNELFKAAKKYGVHIILSSWYYLHTYWYCGDNALNERLHAIPDHEKFQYFAEQLSHIIDLLRQHGYVEQIAFAEILNEADGLKFLGNYGNSNHVSREERRRFGKDHEEAIAWLRKRHPDVLFAYDTYAVGGTDIDLFPHNLQVWNCHCYYLWEIYSLFEGHLLWGGVDVEDPKENSQAMPYLLNPHRALADIYASRNGRMFAEDGWYRRIWLYSQLDPAKVGELEAKFIRQFEKDYGRYQQKIVDVLDGAVAFRDAHCPGVPLVMAEGCTFCASNFLQWEEKCDKYWELLQFAADQFKAHGFMGAAIRTCSGREDPSWNVRKDDYIRIHRFMLEA